MSEASIPRPLVEIYSKPGCCLCVATRAAVDSVRTRLPFELVEHDVREDVSAWKQWRYDIPVVCIDGAVAFVHGVTEAALEEVLRERHQALTAAASRVPAPGESGLR
jgi:glutaredoxin